MATFTEYGKSAASYLIQGASFVKCLGIWESVLQLCPTNQWVLTQDLLISCPELVRFLGMCNVLTLLNMLIMIGYLYMWGIVVTTSFMEYIVTFYLEARIL